MTLDDETEIVHSDMDENGDVKVYIEKPDADNCFRHATCHLPGYRWEDVSGFSDTELQRYQKLIESTSHLILEFAKDGGFEHASSF